MKKKYIFISMFIMNNLFAINADDIVGIWYMPNEKGTQSVIEVFQYNNKYYANGFADKDNLVKDLDKKDLKNPDPELRDRLIKDIVFLYDLTFNGESWYNGQIYNIAKGKYFHAKVELKGNKLYIRASVDKNGVFGKTLIWTKSSTPEKYTPNPREELIKNIPSK